MMKSETSKAHSAVFPGDGRTLCTCGKDSVKTYAGWKRHNLAERRKAGEQV